MVARAERQSPNHGPREGVRAPDLVVLHYTGMETEDAALDRLCAEGAEVSAHYFVRVSGELVAMVPEHRRAWHAGAARWGAIDDVNSHSIGIEISNPGHDWGYQDYPEAQMAALEMLLEEVHFRWGIPPERVIGHSDCAPGRKLDPGEKFDWRRLASAGLSVWPRSDADPVPGHGDAGTRFLAAARIFGYPEGEGFADDAVLRSVRMRFAPATLDAADAGAADAGADEALAVALEDLAARYPVDNGDRASPFVSRI